MTAAAPARDVVADVFAATSRVCGFAPDELRLGKGGGRSLTGWRARAVYIAVARGCSFEEIGRSMDRSTAGARKLALTVTQALARTDSSERAGLDLIEAEMDGGRLLPEGVIDFASAARRIRARRARSA